MHGTLPKNNREWWKAKLLGNVERDKRKDAELIELGWRPLHVWEHQSTDDMVALVVDELQRSEG